MVAERQKKTPEHAGIILEGNTAYQGHGNQISRYSAAKRRQESVSEYILQHKPEFIKEAKHLRQCGCWLYFRHFHMIDEYRLVNGIFCRKHLLCALCAIRRSARQSMEYGLKIQQVLSEADCVPVLITRTVKNGADLAERYGHLNSAHRKMTQRRRQSLSKSTARGSSARSVMRHVLGSVGSYEFKRGKGSGLWHPHSHEIALLEPVFEYRLTPVKNKAVFVPVEFQRKLSEEWLHVTGDSFIVDVRMLDIRDEESFKNAVCEAFKYALKFNGMEVAEQIQAYEVLRGRRLIFSYGCLRGVKVPDTMLDDIDSRLALEPWIDILYRFMHGSYAVQRTDSTGKMADEYLIHDSEALKEVRERCRKEGTLERWDYLHATRRITAG